MIYNIKRGSTTIASVKAIGSQTKELLTQDIVTFSFKSADPVFLQKNDTIEVYGQVYELNEPNDVVIDKSVDGYYYEATFEALYYRLRNWKLKTLDQNNNLRQQAVFVMAKPAFILDLIVKNANANDPSGGWSVGVVDPVDVMQHNFISVTCLAALNDLSNKYNTEFWFDGVNGKRINFSVKQLSSGIILKYGESKGLYNIKRTKSDKPFFNRLIIEGGSNNIPSDYGFTSLQLPLANRPWLTHASAALNGVVEHSIKLENIFPSRIGTVSSIGSSLEIHDSSLDFDINNHLTNQAARISFTSGQLAGFTFSIAGYNHSTKKITINSIEDDPAYPIGVPNSYLKAAVGDQYVLLNIDMPIGYVSANENKLLDIGTQLLDEGVTTQYNYEISVTPKWSKENSFVPVLGHTVNIINEAIGIDEHIRIIGYTRDLQNSWDVKPKVANTATVSDLFKEQYEQKWVNDAVTSSGLSGLTKVNSDTLADVTRRGDITPRHITVGGISVLNGGISDFTDSVFRIPHNLGPTRKVSLLAATNGSGGTPPSPPLTAVTWAIITGNISDNAALTAALNSKVSTVGYNKSNWDTAFGWGNFRDFGLGLTTGIAANDADLDIIDRPAGFVRTTNSTNAFGTSGSLINLAYNNSGGRQQLHISTGTPVMRFRNAVGGVWSSIMRVWSSGDFAQSNINTWNKIDAGSTLTNSITGNAATVTNGLYSTGSYNNPTWLTALAGSKITGNITGSAGSLTTARTIWGQSFNGTSNITGALTGVTDITGSGKVTMPAAEFSTTLQIPHNLGSTRKIGVKAAIDGSGGTPPSPPLTSVTWAIITGNISDNAALTSALNGKVSTVGYNKTNWDAAYSNMHTHANKAVIDGITSGLITNWDTAYSWGDYRQFGLGVFSGVNANSTDLDLDRATSFIRTTNNTNAFGTAGTALNMAYSATGRQQLHISNGSPRLRFRNQVGGVWSEPQTVWTDLTLTTTQIANWTTAFGWGNHALANYYINGEVNIPARGSLYRVFPKGGASQNFDFNTLDAGFYANTFNSGGAGYNAPKNGSGYWFTERLKYGATDNGVQYAHPYRIQDGLYLRTHLNGVWTPFYQVWTSYDLRSNSENDARYLQLTGGTLTGFLNINTSTNEKLRLFSTLAQGGNFIGFYDNTSTRTAYIGHGSTATNNLFYYLPGSFIHNFYTSGVSRLQISDTAVTVSNKITTPEIEVSTSLAIPHNLGSNRKVTIRVAI